MFTVANKDRIRTTRSETLKQVRDHQMPIVLMGYIYECLQGINVSTAYRRRQGEHPLCSAELDRRLGQELPAIRSNLDDFPRLISEFEVYLVGNSSDSNQAGTLKAIEQSEASDRLEALITLAV